MDVSPGKTKTTLTGMSAEFAVLGEMAKRHNEYLGPLGTGQEVRVVPDEVIANIDAARRAAEYHLHDPRSITVSNDEAAILADAAADAAEALQREADTYASLSGDLRVGLRPNKPQA